VLLRRFSVAERTRTLQHQIYLLSGPGERGNTGLSTQGDTLAIDYKGTGLSGDITGKPTVRGIKSRQMLDRFRIRDLVDRREGQTLV
jgi:hypothetical protein